MNERLRRMLRRLPSWLRFRYDANTVGQKLLELLSFPIVDADKEIAALGSEVHLGKTDSVRGAWVYRTAISAPLGTETITVIGNNFTLDEVDDPLIFMRALPDDPLYDTAISYANPYLYDHEQGFLYVRKPYAETPEQPGGFVDVVYRQPNGAERQVRYALGLYHVWNAVDEFALLAGLSRREAEENADLRQRIWDRFGLPKDEGPAGIASRLAQSIGLLRQLQWTDTSAAFTLPEPHVAPDLVLVDGIGLMPGDYRIDSGDRVVLLPRNSTLPLTVRYVAGLRVRPASAGDLKIHQRSVAEVTPAWGRMRYNMAAWLPEEIGSAQTPTGFDPDLSVWL